MAIVQTSIVPIGIEGTSHSPCVAKTFSFLLESSLDCEPTAVEIITSGETHEIWDLQKKMYESCFDVDMQRFLKQTKIDNRPGKDCSPHRRFDLYG